MRSLVLQYLIHVKDILLGWGQDSVQASQVLAHPCLYRSCFVVMLKQEGAIHQTVAQNVLVCWNNNFFTGTKGPNPATKNQQHTLIPPLPNFTSGKIQSEKYWCPGNFQTHSCLSDFQTVKRGSSPQRTRLDCSRVQWWRALHDWIQHSALGDVRSGCSCFHGNPFHVALCTLSF